MLVKSTLGTPVFFINTDKKTLIDINNTRWTRSPERDLDGCAAYTNNADSIYTVLLSKEDLVRVCSGKILTPVSVEEMRYYSGTMVNKLRSVVDGWSDQKLREILSDADESNKNPGHLMEDIARKELEQAEREAKAKQKAEETPEKGQEKPRENTEAHNTGKNTRSRRKQEGSLSLALEGVTVLLTPKQLEFMERLSECPGWDKSGTGGRYYATEYAEELSDTMNPMSMGAILTTLREKGLLRTEKARLGATKCCVFSLTELGTIVYNKLAERG